MVGSDCIRTQVQEYELDVPDQNLEENLLFRYSVMFISTVTALFQMYLRRWFVIELYFIILNEMISNYYQSIGQTDSMIRRYVSDTRCLLLVESICSVTGGGLSRIVCIGSIVCYLTRNHKFLFRNCTQLQLKKLRIVGFMSMICLPMLVCLM